MHRLMRAIHRVRRDEDAASTVEYVGISIVVVGVIAAMTLASTGIGNAVAGGLQLAACAAVGDCPEPELAAPDLPTGIEVAAPAPIIQREVNPVDGPTSQEPGDGPGVDPLGNPTIVLPDGTVAPVSDGTVTDPATGQPVDIAFDPETGEPVGIVSPDGSIEPLSPEARDALAGEGIAAGDPGSGNGPNSGDPGTGNGPNGSDPGTGNGPNGSDPGTGNGPNGSDPGTGNGPDPSTIDDITRDAPTAGDHGSPEPGSGSGPTTPNGGNPDDPGANDVAVGDPVNTRSGAFTTAGTDLVVPGAGPFLRLGRSYSSTDGRAGPLGPGWTHAYDIAIEGPDRRTVLVRTESGFRIPFTRQRDDAEFAAPAGIHSTLRATDDGFVLERRDGRSITFDGDGRATSIADPNDLATTLDYDDGGRLIGVKDPSGRTLAFGWDGDRIISASLQDGRTVTYGYDRGRLVQVVDAVGTFEQYSYDEQDRIATVTDNAGNRLVENTYDDDDRVVGQTNALGHTFSYEYVDDGPHSTTFTTDPMGNRTAYVYSGARLVRVVDALGATTTMRYDDDLNMVEAEDALGNVTRIRYDGLGQPTRIVQPEGREIGMRWGPFNRVTQVVDAEGGTTKVTYDEAGNPLSLVAADGEETTWSYEGEIAGLPTSVTDAQGGVRTFEHDDAGHITGVVDPTGSRYEFEWSEAGNLVGVLGPMAFAEGAEPDDHRWTYSYDALNRLVGITDPLEGQVAVTYDAMSRVSSVTDADDERTAYEYDPLGRLTTVVAPDATTTGYRYDAEGRVIQRTTPLGEVTQYRYDAAGRMSATSSPAGQRWLYERDALGRVTRLTTPEGSATPAPDDGVIEYAYDALGRVVVTNAADAPAVRTTWSPNNRITEVRAGDQTASYDFDPLGRMTSFRMGDQAIDYGYDTLGRLVERSVGDDTTTYGYDASGRLTSVDGALSATFEHDLAGRVVETVLGNGARVQAAYNRTGMPAKVTSLDAAGDVVQTSSYLYSPDGLPTTVRTLDEVTTHQYDDLDRLVRSTATSRATGRQLGQWTYQYDDAGHRIAEDTPAGVSTFAWAPGDQLVQIEGPDGDVTDIGYDANGRRVAHGDDSYTYDLFDRLVQSDVGGVVTDYTFDALGHRAAATSDSTAAEFVWDPNAVNEQLLSVTTGGETSTSTLMPAVGTLGMTTDVSRSYLHADALGSVVGTTTGDGDIGWRYGYEPFGAERTAEQETDGAMASPLRFVGEFQDPSGDYHLRARQMDPATGTFASIDPMPDLLHLPYQPVNSYVDGSPTVHTDPSGKFFNIAAGAIGAAVGGVVGGGVELIKQASSGEGIDWGRVGTAAAGGAVAGAFVGLTAGAGLLVGAAAASTGSSVAIGAGIGAIAGASGALTTETLDRYVHPDRDPFDWGNVALATVFGGITGGIGGGISATLPAPVGNPSALTGLRPGELTAIAIDLSLTSQIGVVLDLTAFGLSNSADGTPSSAATK